ncbi:MAG: DUF1064 domain-containing protein [Bacteroidales bacterium]
MVQRIVKKVNKFGNIFTVCRHGHNHPSKGEAEHCDKLHLCLAATNTDIRFIHYEKSYDLVVNGVKVGKHKPDWTLERFDGSYKIVEYKGMSTPVWKLKLKMFKAQYPDIPYEVVYKKSYGKVHR